MRNDIQENSKSSEFRKYNEPFSKKSSRQMTEPELIMCYVSIICMDCCWMTSPL